MKFLELFLEFEAQMSKKYLIYFTRGTCKTSVGIFKRIK